MISQELLYSLEEDAHTLQIYPDPRFPPSLYFRFLYRLVDRLHPQVSVELGTCGGGASLHMAAGYPEGLVVSVDVANDYPDQIEYIVQTYHNFRFWRCDSIDAADRYRDQQLPPVEVLFIDTIHTYDRTMREFAAWRDLLSKNAIVLLDDLYRAGMDRVWSDLPGKKVRLDKMHLGGSPTDGGFGAIFDIGGAE